MIDLLTRSSEIPGEAFSSATRHAREPTPRGRFSEQTLLASLQLIWLFAAPRLLLPLQRHSIHGDAITKRDGLYSMVNLPKSLVPQRFRSVDVVYLR